MAFAQGKDRNSATGHDSAARRSRPPASGETPHRPLEALQSTVGNAGVVQMLRDRKSVV